MPVQRVSRPNRTFRGFQGQIESGTISTGDVITALPSGEKAGVKEILTAGKKSESAFRGQPVTICLDREVDVSRGCVLVKDANLAVYKKLTVSLLWMDDSELTAGKDYLIKLGTKTITGIVSKINYAVDVNTGEHIHKESLKKNEIAVCEILLAEPIVADQFRYHKTLGELILIDRVTNMTSACGVVEGLSEKGGDFTDKASFSYNGIEARGDIFEEFYYDEDSLAVLKYQPAGKTFTIGDVIPTAGNSYKYPDSFDIIVLRDSTAVKIRDKKVSDIIPLSEYNYGGVPVINGRGFEVLVSDENETKQFIEEYKQTNDEEKSAFFEKWMKFDTYRKVTFGRKK